MTCDACDTELVRFDVPPDYRDAVPGGAEHVGLCPHCLSLQPVADAPPDPAFERVGDDFPTHAEAAIPLAVLVGLLDNLATYRAEITDLLVAVERAGVDPLLVIDRLATNPEIDADVDLKTRQRQLEQLL